MVTDVVKGSLLIDGGEGGRGGGKEGGGGGGGRGGGRAGRGKSKPGVPCPWPQVQGQGGVQEEYVKRRASWSHSLSLHPHLFVAISQVPSG